MQSLVPYYVDFIVDCYAMVVFERILAHQRLLFDDFGLAEVIKIGMEFEHSLAILFILAVFAPENQKFTRF